MKAKFKLNKRLMSFLTPLAFALAGYLTIFVAFGSVISPIIGVWNMVTAETDAYKSEDLTINRLDGYTETVPSSLITFPQYGDLFGRLTIKSAGIDAPVYYGDSDRMLKKGVCQYNGTLYVGSGTTVMLSAHNNTYFHTLGEAAVGDKVLLSTNYGDYVYEVDRAEVRSAYDTSAYDLEADYENLVLYTCYPFNALGLTDRRYFVYCRYISGPKILYDE